MRARVLLSLLVAITTGCADSSTDSPPPTGPATTLDGRDVALSIGDGMVNPNMTEEGCQQTPGCWDGPESDPDVTYQGYYLPTYSPATCFSSTGTGINDLDRDGMDERCEEKLAEMFRPVMSLAPPNQDCDMGMEPYWAAKYFPDHSNTVRVFYAMAYYQDCGTNGSLGNTLFKMYGNLVSLAGLGPNPYEIIVGSTDGTEGHTGDSEWITVDINYNALKKHWYATSLVTSAHWGGNADGTVRTPASGIEWGQNQGGYPNVWVMRGKHANYPSRSKCNASRAPGVHDDCDPNIPKVSRVYFHYIRNLGSLHQNLINYRSCVQSLNRPTLNTGTECFWRMTTRTDSAAFFGWNTQPLGAPPMAYGNALTLKFECYATSGTNGGTCIDRGVVR